MSPPKLSSYSGGGRVSDCIDQLLPQTKLVGGKSLLVPYQARQGQDQRLFERVIRRSLVTRNMANLLSQARVSSEGSAENGILRRKYLQRQLPGSTSTERGILVKKYIRLYRRTGPVCKCMPVESDTKCCGHNAQVSCVKGRSKSCMLEIGVRGAKMPAFSATTSVCQVIVGLVHRQGIPGSGYSQRSRLSLCKP